MSLKDNFNQAVKEILKKDGLVGDDLSKDAKKKSELDKYIDPPRKEEPTFTDEPEIIPERSAESYTGQEQTPSPEPEQRAEQPRGFSDNPYVRTAQSAADFGSRPSEPYSPDPFGMGANPPPQPQPVRDSGYGMGGQTGQQGQGAAGGAGYGMGGAAGYGQGTGYPGQGMGYGGSVPPRIPNNPPPYRGGGKDTPYYETEETTIISRNTIIDGNIRSFANINVDGSVKGDVRITKDINVTGKVVGDIECNNSVMTGASMQGNIASKGQVQLDRDSMLLGDIAAQYLDMNGKIKGNIDIGGKAEFKTDAVVMGNITASTITVLDGATIQGYVNTTFLQESTANIFPEAIAVTE